MQETQRRKHQTSNIELHLPSNFLHLTSTGAVGGAAGVIHQAASATTDCQPNANVEALRVWMDAVGVEARPVWKPMHKQPVYRHCPPTSTAPAKPSSRWRLRIISGKQ